MVSKEKLRAFLVVSRGNLMLASIGHPTLGLFLGAGSLSDLLNIRVFFFILLHFTAAFFACNINCYYDYNVDKRYKKEMSSAVDMIGKRNMVVIMFFELTLAAMLLSYLFSKGFYITGFAGLTGILGAMGYSAEPIRIKRRGLASPLPIFLLYSLPLIGGWFLFKNHLDVYFILFLVGYVFMNEGFTLVNMCEDFSEDKKEGVTTWAHILGLRKTLSLAYIFSTLGTLTPLGIILKYHVENNFVLKIKETSLLVAVTISFFMIILAASDVRDITRNSENNLEDKAKEYGKKLQKWFLMTRYPLMISALLALL